MYSTENNFVKLGHVVFGRPFVKRFALCYRTVVCPVCSIPSVTLVYCGQTVGRIKMKLGTQVGLGSGHIVLDGEPGPLPQSGTDPPIFGPYQLWLNGSTNQDATWYEGRPRPRPHCITWRPSSPSEKGHSPSPPNIRPISIVAKRSPIPATAKHLLWPPIVMGRPLYFCSVVSSTFFFLYLSFFLA